MATRFMPEDDPECQRLFGALSSGQFLVRNVDRVLVGKPESGPEHIHLVVAVYQVEDPLDRKTASDTPEVVLALPLHVAENLKDALNHFLRGG